MKTFAVTGNDAGQRLDRFITKVCPALPQALMYKYIRTKRIKLNGKRAEIFTRVAAGDRVDAYINDEFFMSAAPKFDFLSSSPVLNIVYEDENILLADKPQGLIVHPDKNEYHDTLIGRIQHYLWKKGEYDPDSENSFKPALANRIDRNTGGIVMAAKNSAALRVLCDKIKSREIDKRYLAVVHGVPAEKSATLEGYLAKDSENNIVHLSGKKTADNLKISTKYRVIASKNGLSLVEVELLTGRTHQIRAHMASIGHPLLGDGKYGRGGKDKKTGFDKQALYSYKLAFRFKTDAGILNYLNGKTFTAEGVWFAKNLFGIDCNRIPNTDM